jgi:outer membrane protein OmpA-like peptidoglycan-associated protein
MVKKIWFSLIFHWLKKADIIANYLVNNWKIEKKRLKTGFIKKPTLPTSETYIEGFEENRRVELVSDDFRITEPVIHRKFSEFKNLTTQIFFDVKNNEKIKNWELTLNLNNSEIKSIKGEGKVPDLFKIDDIIGSYKLKNTDEIKAKLELEFFDLPNKTNLTKNITIETDKNIFETGRLNLIVFDFDKSEITDFNQYMIENFVKSEVQTTSVLKVTGSTDKLGEALYNEKLSQQRADNVSQYLRKMIPNVNIKESKGVGFNQNNIDNDIPEGRFYSRTVLIEVETPVK